MLKALKTGAAALAICSIGSTGWTAAGPCARPQDVSAMQVAAVQQSLMVAALSCNAVSRYNAFVQAYQRELQASDRALQNYFQRMSGRRGTAEYHAFKTKLANASSALSITDITAYCARANTSFNAVLEAAKPTLTAFVSATPVSFEERYARCEYRVAGSFLPDRVEESAADEPEVVPIPSLKRSLPVMTVMSASGRGLVVRFTPISPDIPGLV